MATLFFMAVLLCPRPGFGNLANYSRINKSTPVQTGLLAGLRDTIPPPAGEDFDTPFGKSRYTPENPDPFSTKEAPPSMVIPTFKVDIDTSFVHAQKLPVQYSGFKIEIQTAKEPLPSSHDIFFQHGKLVEDQLQDGTYSYLLGDFPTADEANAFMLDFLINRYPKARVVEYDGGGRLY